MNRHPNTPARFLVLLGTLALSHHTTAGEVQPTGERPYEMVWANRTNDTRPPLIDFEDLDGWTIVATDAVAAFTRSREQPLWGGHVGRLVYRATGKSPTITLKPPRPLEVASAFDCVNLWLYGNNWGWAPDSSTPPVDVVIRLRGKAGAAVAVPLGRVNWKEWFLMHRKLSPEQLQSIREGASIEGIQISNGHNREDRILYLDNLALYREELPPLRFEPRPRRGVDPVPGQSPGNNVGPGRLPFPKREETILPDNLTRDFTVELQKSGPAFVFRYRGDDGGLEYRYEPKTGTLGDVTARFDERGGDFHPMTGGGVYVARAGTSGLGLPDAVELVQCDRVGDTVVSQWRGRVGDRTVEFSYTFRLWQKSLVIDVKCLGGEVREFRVGRVTGLENPRLVTLPYLSFLSTRPAVLVSGPPANPLFLFALLDYYRSNGSELWARNEVAVDGVTCNGGSRYHPTTDGNRNHCFERLFLTVSPRFEEVLPNIPNDPSPWRLVAGDRLWVAHGASNRTNDYNRWKRVARYGMTNLVITDHETGWRDGGESFTFRTRAAPKKGGDDGQAEYARRIHALGFRYGIYNNYTDFAPVNEFWQEDMVTRQSDGQWRPAWPRCYNPKPARAVEYEARLAPIIQEKFHLDTAYCDVHTAVAPWSYVDFDARVPGAGTFAATLYAYGEIMLHQKATWNGPVYSEGNQHWYYCGLTDGNYAQDQSARLPVNPWLVDFDLRKLHPLCCNFGMGNWEMFFGRSLTRGMSSAEKEAMFDRFLAATLAFGHTGFFLSNPARPDQGVRSYFTVQQVHANYARAVVTDVRYADEQGRLLDTSSAVATGAFRRSQIATRYDNGMRVWVNGHPSESWTTPHGTLPPNGWHVECHAPELTAWSLDVQGHRADYVEAPAYLYADARGQLTDFPRLKTDGQMIAHRRGNGTLEVIPVGPCSTFGVSLDGRTATAIALDGERTALGPAETRLSRGLVYVMPVTNAFSYGITPGEPPAIQLRSARESVVPGETVEVLGQSSHRFTVPRDARPGTCLWQSFEGAWIDFTVTPVADVTLSAGTNLLVELVPHLPTAMTADILLGAQTRTAELRPERMTRVEFPLDQPREELTRVLPLRIVAGEFTHQEQWTLEARRHLLSLAAMPEHHRAGQGLRRQAETVLDEATGAAARVETMSCGGVSKRGVFMHPPYQTGVGYAFVLFDPVTLPVEPRAAFRCEVGKRDESDPGDGILFRIVVVDLDGRETVVTSKHWTEHAWTPLEADLGPWAGKTIRLKLVSDVGPADNSTGDWSCWADLRVESVQPVMQIAVHR